MLVANNSMSFSKSWSMQSDWLCSSVCVLLLRTFFVRTALWICILVYAQTEKEFLLPPKKIDHCFKNNTAPTKCHHAKIYVTKCSNTNSYHLLRLRVPTYFFFAFFLTENGICAIKKYFMHRKSKRWSLSTKRLSEDQFYESESIEWKVEKT